MGRIELNNARKGQIGVVQTGDTLGEEGIVEERGNFYRFEKASATEESFVLELPKDKWLAFKERCYGEKLEIDFFTLKNVLKKNYV